MKFGALLEQKRNEGPAEFAPYYLRYSELKTLLKVLPRHHTSLDLVSTQTALNRRLTPSGCRDEVAQAAMTEERFVKIVEDDLQRVGHWVMQQSESLHAELGKLLTNCSNESYTLDSLREQADELGKMTCELDKLILLNYEGFLKIAKKHDKWIGLSTRPWMLARLSTASFFHERFDKIVSGLSDAYAILRLREHPEEEGVWAPPSEFNRKTTKYWVKPEDVLSIKCEMVKHIPVLIFGRKLSASAAGGANQPSDSSLITSVYLDNESLEIYHTRLDRLDGSTLFRFRWYGPCSGPNHSVFVERKTHRGPETKKTTGLLSVKERFKVKWSDISDLLAGTLDLQKRVEEPLRAEGAKEEEVAYAMNLAHECQQEISLRRLRPVITTVYYRTSFQLNSSNTVRSTLDCQLRMVDETSTRSSLAPGEWYRPLNTELIKDVHEFPYSVLEIKLQGDAPDWVKALIDSGKIVKCDKFSKYLHSIVALGHPVHKPPHWFGEDHVFLLLPMAPGGSNRGSSTTSSGPPSMAGGASHLSSAMLGSAGVRTGATTDSEMGGGCSIDGTAPESTCTAGSNNSADESTKKDKKRKELKRDLPRDKDKTDTGLGGGSGAGGAVPGSTGTDGSNKNADESRKKDKKRKEPKRDPPQDVEKADSELGGGSSTDGTAPESTGTGGSNNSADESRKKDKKRKESKRDPSRDSDKDRDDEPPRAKTLVRKRVDPKTLFANERTMLQWLNMAVLLVFTSLALLATSTAITNSGEASSNAKAVAGGAQLCGAILAPAAILVMLYAMWQYYWRISRITDPDEDARFEDKFGPLVLVFMIICVCSVAIVISINRFSWGNFSLRGAPTGKASKKGGAGDAGGAALSTPTATASDAHATTAKYAQEQPIEFGGPRSSLMLLQTDSGLRLGPLSWAIAAFCWSTSFAILLTSQSPLFVLFRRRLWRQLQGVHAGDDEDAGLLGSSMGSASWGKMKVGGGAAGYGSAEPSDVPAFEAVCRPPAAAVSVSGGSLQRLPRASAEERRWDRMVATMLPEGRSRLHADRVPFHVA